MVGTPILTRSQMLDKLKELHPRTFENLLYDLLVLCGVRNLLWRTPGADGGRDLEGNFITSDLSGSITSERWYFECKRYSNAIPWPMVFEKLSYALNQGADFLLFATTSSLSTQCLDEVQTWNLRRQRPLIRHWPGYKIVELIGDQPKLLVKYNLTGQLHQNQNAFLSLSNHLAKATQSAYSAQEFGKELTPTIELAAALSELLSTALDNLHNNHAYVISPFENISIDGYSWVRYSGKPCLVDRLVFRALLATIKLTSKSKGLIVSFKNAEFVVSQADNAAMNANESTLSLLNELSFWGNLEFNVGNNEFRFTVRPHHD